MTDSFSEGTGKKPRNHGPEVRHRPFFDSVTETFRFTTYDLRGKTPDLLLRRRRVWTPNLVKPPERKSVYVRVREGLWEGPGTGG